MMDSTLGQIVIGILLGVIAVVFIRKFQNRTGINVSELLFGSKKKEETKGEKEKKKEFSGPKGKNGTKADLTVFISQLLRAAGKRGMRVVAPGTVQYKGEMARLTAFLISPSGVTGIYCLGFGGEIRTGGEGNPWCQYMNGEKRTFENPVLACRKQYELVRGAMDEAGLTAPLDIVAVFTNKAAVLPKEASGTVYSQERFIEHIKNTHAFQIGSTDLEQTTKVLAKLAGIKERKKKNA